MKGQAIANVDLIALLDIAAEKSESKPVIFLFDQFEQFFAHHKSQEERESFVQAMAAWFKDTAKTHAKILLSIRSDFSDRLYEFQEVMEYSLIARQNYFQIKKFTPQEATAIFREIAAFEQLTFDEQFVKEMTAKELAGREDNLISPVDIQILALMLKGQKSTEARALTRKAYQQLGGIEGLLERFLIETIEVQTIHNINQLALKVLLALTDLEHNVRAGELTLAELRNRLKEDVTVKHLQGTIGWLHSLRLINLTQRQHQAETYELAQERLILPIRKLSGKLLGEADRANQLLDRRVNEWIGNNEHSRYLLNWQELRLIKKQKPYLIYGKQKQQKEKLISKSKKRLYLKLSGIFLPILPLVLFLLLSKESNAYSILSKVTIGLAVTGFSISMILFILFLGWWYSPQGQIWQVKYELVKLSEKIKNYPFTQLSLSNVAVALLKNGNFQKAIELAEKVEHFSQRFGFPLPLINIAKIFVEVGKADKAIKVLDEAVQETEKISGLKLYNKVRPLQAIANAFVEIGETDKAIQILEKALHVAENISGGPYADNFIGIANVFVEIGKTEKAIEILERAVKFTEKNENSYWKVRNFIDISDLFKKMGKTDKAIQILEKAIQAQEKIEDSEFGDKVATLTLIAKVFMELDETRKATQFLEEAYQITEKALQIGEGKKTLEFFNRAYELNSIAKTFAEMGKTDKAIQLLEQAVHVAEKEEDFYFGTVALENITKAFAEIGEIDKAIQVAEKIDVSEIKDSALISIVQAYAKMENWREARHIANMPVADANKAESFAAILSVWAEKKHPELKNKD